MLHKIELEIISILSDKKEIKKEELIIQFNLEKRNKNEVELGYRAFKSVIESLEHKSLITRRINNTYQLTSSGIREFIVNKFSLAMS